jgi:septum formation protein
VANVARNCESWSRPRMTTSRGGLLSGLTRTDSPRRETLRAELARTKPAGRRAGLTPKLVLASASPRRLTLLAQVGVEPDALRPSSIDESPRKGEMPRSVVTRLSRAKAEDARRERLRRRARSGARRGRGRP